MAKFIKLYESNPSKRHLETIVNVLKKGGLIIYPTDTVYGLGCDIFSSQALVKIARIKGVKPEKANLSFICSDLGDLSKYIKQLDNSTFKLLRLYLPGPFTFILKGSNELPKSFKRKKNVGIRIPNNEIALCLVRTLGNPLISTSIHDTDKILDYTTDPEIIFEHWKDKVDLIIDGGVGGNVPSTVVDLSQGEPIVLRQGKGDFSIDG